MMVSYARKKKKKKKKKLLKLHLKFDKKQFSDIVTVDESGYTFWSYREVSNKFWATISTKRSCIARRTMIVRKFCMRSSFNLWACNSGCGVKG